MNYNNKIFKPVQTSGNGEVSDDTIFVYKQNDDILTCEYSGKNIVKGHLIGKVDDKGNIDMRYHQVNVTGELMTGVCNSTPFRLPNGKIRLIEKWKWTSGSNSKGESIIEEI